jgi:hypothetical protein
MRVDFRLHCLLGYGSYAEVFAVEGRALKLFTSGPEVPPRQTREGRRRVFECECEAYQLVSNEPWLRDHVATFYGPCVPEDVVDKDGTSVRNNYLLNCCYALELIGPAEIAFKATTEGVRDNNEHIRRAIERFGKLGIEALDSSVFFHSDPERFKFIDIGMKDCY